MSERLRAFAGRQMALREKLRWAPPRSARRRDLEAELRRLVREELEAELGSTPASPSPQGASAAGGAGPYGGREPYWIEH